MTLKKIFQNKPFIGARGHYHYYGWETIAEYRESTGIPSGSDKFVDRDLYSQTFGNDMNELMIKGFYDNDGDWHPILDPGASSIKIDKMYIKNVDRAHDGGGDDLCHVHVNAYMFDLSRAEREWIGFDFKGETGVTRTSGSHAYKSNHVTDPMDAGGGYYSDQWAFNWWGAAMNPDGTLTPVETEGYFVDNGYVPDDAAPGRAVYYPKTTPKIYGLLKRLSTIGCRFFSYGKGDVGKSKDPGIVMENTTIMTGLSALQGEVNIGSWDHKPSDFSIDCFAHRYDTVVNGIPGLHPDNDDVSNEELIKEYWTMGGGSDSNTLFDPEHEKGFLYIAVLSEADSYRWFGKDARRHRIDVFEIPHASLFDIDDTNRYYGKVTKFKFRHKDAATYEAGSGGSGGRKHAALHCSELDITIDTTPGFDYSLLSESRKLKEEVNVLTASMKSPEWIRTKPSVDRFQYEVEFLNQHPNCVLQDLNPEDSSLSRSDMWKLHTNFEPIAEVTIDKNPEFDLTAYHREHPNNPLDDSGTRRYTGDQLRQICSAPAEVNLGFNVGGYYYDDHWLWADQTAGKLRGWLGAKFFVIDWNDVDDNYNSIDDYLLDRPITIPQLIEKHKQNLYKLTDIDEVATHTYRTPGIKKIKAIFVTHTIGTSGNPNRTQAIRWKFCKIRAFLDIPKHEVPDFQKLGGVGYTTIPWPNTVPVVGGINKDSKYFKSLNIAYSGDKIGMSDHHDELLLSQAVQNTELGQSVNKMDLEQIRYFNNSYGMNQLLGIDNLINDKDTLYYNTNRWDCKDWDTTRNDCFSDKTSVGEIFISDNSDINLKSDCIFEINCGEVADKIVIDSNGAGNKGFLIGDYKLKKRAKDVPLRRDSFIKLAKKETNDGAL